MLRRPDLLTRSAIPGVENETLTNLIEFASLETARVEAWAKAELRRLDCHCKASSCSSRPAPTAFGGQTSRRRLQPQHHGSTAHLSRARAGRTMSCEGGPC
jgi:hypothetical protein